MVTLIFITVILLCLNIVLSTLIILRQTTNREPIKTPPKPLFKPKKKPSEEEIKLQKVLDNIDAYDGSGKGQVKV